MARSTTSELATVHGHASTNGSNGHNGAGPDIFNEAYLASELPLIGSGRKITRSTLVRTARQRRNIHDQDGLVIPNLVEMQLESYQWFLNTGLRELFNSFSPIEDFTGTMSLEFLDYTLGEPKFEPDECRQRDLTYEMPMKVKVRVVNKETGELKVDLLSVMRSGKHKVRCVGQRYMPVTPAPEPGFGFFLW